jgi:hypothetical protein
MFLLIAFAFSIDINLLDLALSALLILTTCALLLQLDGTTLATLQAKLHAEWERFNAATTPGYITPDQHQDE